VTAVFLAHYSADEEHHEVLSVHASMLGAKEACVVHQRDYWQRGPSSASPPPEPSWTVSADDPDPWWQPQSWGDLYWVERCEVKP
jgi:hypothetical protein